MPGSLLIRNPKTGLTVEARIFKAKEFTTDVQNLPREITPTNVYYLRREDRRRQGGRGAAGQVRSRGRGRRDRRQGRSSTCSTT